jgi:small subunit ribosomal protein S5
MEKVREKEVKDGYVEKLVKLNRVAKVVKGGRRFSFSALVVVGYGDGRVGYGFGKANDVTDAIRKATDKAKTSIITVPLKGNTIPHDIIGNFKSASILMKPAVPGTGVIAGGAVRSVLELAGIENILSKSLGSKSPLNAARATMEALKAMKPFKVAAARRGLTVKEMLN